ncbi:outer membrane efflux protein [Rhodopirellula maiorica SM1]|uniref:Outer membrane efflux protein n=1 Tax=Rhodopirellula maiorica SM1 TaxID=1265738 RepID=M5RSC7_9BACT|nr:TolC family protein [Rhodopirellula maiorica]EMI22200.1 outer membrane efflux protein [Rhodopirellula maiorica SM1]
MSYVGLLVGCGMRSRELRPATHVAVTDSDSIVNFDPQWMEVKYTCVSNDPIPIDSVQLPPQQRETWELTLDSVVQMALSRSQVIRDIGGAVVSAPDSVSTVFDSVIVRTDPRFGVEAALSDFDAQLASSLLYSGREQTLNNVIEGKGTQDPRANLGLLDFSISKITRSGTQFKLGNLTTFDRNNSPLNRFSQSFTGGFQGEIRHPLKQGSGRAFNEIAGPGSSPGNYRGVRVAQLNTHIEIADFQAAIRDLLLDVERAYWELSFSYRNLDAKLQGRDAALATWRVVQARLETGDADGAEEALARERYYAWVSEVEDALIGRTAGLAGSSASDNSTVGYETGLLAAERRLRFLIGIPFYDGKLIRPVDETIQAEIIFDRPTSFAFAIQQRVELQTQQLKIRRLECELLAARNFLLPQLDLIGQYRMHGFGQDLLGTTSEANSGAYSDLFRGDLQDWTVGFEWKSPIGFRQGHAAVRNAQFQLMREQAIYREQQRQVTIELDAAFAELHRAFVTNDANQHRVVGARQRVEAIRDKYQVVDIPLEFVNIAIQRAVDAETALARSQVEHTMAVATVHYVRGTYLAYLDVFFQSDVIESVPTSELAGEITEVPIPDLIPIVEDAGLIEGDAYLPMPR